MMVVQGSRRSGKSTALLRWMADAPEDVTRVVIAPSHIQSENLRRMASDMGIDTARWRFRHANENHLLLGLGGDVEVGIDEWTDCPEDLRSWLTHPVKFMTETVSQDEDWSPEW